MIRHRFLAVIIPQAVGLYFRFALSDRDIEDSLAERGVDASVRRSAGRSSSDCSSGNDPRRYLPSSQRPALPPRPYIVVTMSDLHGNPGFQPRLSSFQPPSKGFPDKSGSLGQLGYSVDSVQPEVDAGRPHSRDGCSSRLRRTLEGRGSKCAPPLNPRWSSPESSAGLHDRMTGAWRK